MDNINTRVDMDNVKKPSEGTKLVFCGKIKLNKSPNELECQNR